MRLGIKLNPVAAYASQSLFRITISLTYCSDALIVET